MLTAISSAVLAANLYVSKTGSDAASGDEANPFLTINRAAQVAQRGDVVTVRAGTYRERVTPARGGSAAQRITYRAAPGEKVSIKGSDQITSWTLVSGTTYSVTLPDSYFGSFNPYTRRVSGNYLYGDTVEHLGCVYLNDQAYVELQSQSAVQGQPGSWTATRTGTNTTIYANFGGANPNAQLAEINVRPTVFFPSQPLVIDYITVQGFTISQAATNWAPPDPRDGEPGTQEGAIGSLGGAFWIIENCTVRYSRNVCIAFGRYNEEPNASQSLSQMGNHIIRNNVIQRCGQAGIAGKWWLSRSRIVGNLIEDINYLNEWGGYEQANIKFHDTSDLTIEGNLIRQGAGQVPYGVWVDWGNTNVRFSRNVIHGFDNAFFMEQNFGPFLFDNNVLIGGQFEQWATAGTVGAHNLYVDVEDNILANEGSRQVEIYQPHSLGWSAMATVQAGYGDKRYNNVYVKRPYSGSTTPGSMDDYNLYLGGASKTSFSKDTNGQVSSIDPGFTYVSDAAGFRMSWDPGGTLDSFTVPLLTSDTFGLFQPTNMRVENVNGSTITIDRDFFGVQRSLSNPRVGPFATGSQFTGRVLFDAARVGAGSPPTPAIVVQYNFEASAQGWARTSGSASVYRSTARADEGSASLAVMFSNTTIGNTSVAVSSPPVPAGAAVRFHVYVPASTSLTVVEPFALETNGRVTRNSQPTASLRRSAWNIIDLAVPANAAALQQLGVNFSTDAGFYAAAYIDSVTW